VTYITGYAVSAKPYLENVSNSSSLGIEIEIAHSLAQSVLEYEDMLITASDFCAELDLYGQFESM